VQRGGNERRATRIYGSQILGAPDALLRIVLVVRVHCHSDNERGRHGILQEKGFTRRHRPAGHPLGFPDPCFEVVAAAGREERSRTPPVPRACGDLLGGRLHIAPGQRHAGKDRPGYRLDQGVSEFPHRNEGRAGLSRGFVQTTSRPVKLSPQGRRYSAHQAWADVIDRQFRLPEPLLGLIELAKRDQHGCELEEAERCFVPRASGHRGPHHVHRGLRPALPPPQHRKGPEGPTQGNVTRGSGSSCQDCQCAFPRRLDEAPEAPSPTPLRRPE
jgi:hypothetical protein